MIIFTNFWALTKIYTILPWYGLKNKVIRYSSPEITDNKINIWIVQDELDNDFIIYELKIFQKF